MHHFYECEQQDHEQQGLILYICLIKDEGSFYQIKQLSQFSLSIPNGLSQLDSKLSPGLNPGKIISWLLDAGRTGKQFNPTQILWEPNKQLRYLTDISKLQGRIIAFVSL